MSRSKKDQKGGHPWAGYGVEDWVAKQLTRRQRRRAGKIEVQNLEDERKVTPPEKSTGGWTTW